MRFSSEVISSGHQLAESPGWNKFINEFYWVDIETSEIFVMQRGAIRRFVSPFGATSAHALGQNDYLITGDNSIGHFINGVWRVLWVSEEIQPEWRFNDSTLLPNGNLVVGTKSTRDLHQNQRVGLWDGTKLEWKFNGMTLSNGMAIEELKSRLIIADSISRQLFSWGLSVTGEVDFEDEPGVFAVLSEGEPDGLSIDSEGMLWLALWGTGKLIQLDALGTIKQTLQLAAENVSSVSWGGKDSRSMLVTTARGGTNNMDAMIECAGGDVVLLNVYDD